MDEHTEVAALIAAGDDDKAFAELRARLGWPRGKDIVDLTRWLSLLGELAVRRGSATLREQAEHVVRDPDSPDRLYDLGYALIDAGAPAIAATVLWRCLALVGDSEEVVCELVSALESALAYRDAFAILEEHAALRARSFLCQYLYAFNAAMTGQLAVVRRALEQLTPDGPETEGMVDTIVAIVDRADRIAGACPLDDTDLRGWHYVLTGGLLMHRSPYGFDAGMRGRYAWLRDSLPLIASGIARLVPLARGVPCVYAAPGRNSELLGRAIAAALDVPLVPWPAIGVPAPGLVAIYDLTELAQTDVARLLQRKPEQIVFAHAASWTADAALSPDVVTLFAQHIEPPWRDDPRGDDELVAAIGSASRDAFDERDEPERWAALVARAWPLPPALRSRLWAAGPVASNPL